MTTETRPLTEITQSAIRLLCREMGVVSTARFLNQFNCGHGNYTEERDQLFGHMTVSEIAAAIQRRRNSDAAP